MIATATLLIAGIAIASAGAGVGAYSAVASAGAQADAAKYNAAVARNNAMSAEQQGEFAAEQLRERNRKVIGAERASYAKSGVDSSGSANDIMQESAANGEMDVLSAIYTGKVSSNSSTARARLDELQASSAETAGQFGAASSALSGLGSGVSLYANVKNPRFGDN